MMQTLTLYSRQRCGLCEEALHLVRSLQGSIAFDLRIVDVDGDADLTRRYGDLVPVVETADGRRVAAPVTERKLRELLALEGDG